MLRPVAGIHARCGVGVAQVAILSVAQVWWALFVIALSAWQGRARIDARDGGGGGALRRRCS